MYKSHSLQMEYSIDFLFNLCRYKYMVQYKDLQFSATNKRGTNCKHPTIVIKFSDIFELTSIMYHINVI